MLNQEELKTIRKHIKDFGITATLNLSDLQYYDNNIFKKLDDKNLYEEIADINLNRINGPTIYGGENIRIYKSKTKKHYIYSCYYWGD